jgi:hypothetical protein
MQAKPNETCGFELRYDDEEKVDRTRLEQAKGSKLVVTLPRDVTSGNNDGILTSREIEHFVSSISYDFMGEIINRWCRLNAFFCSMSLSGGHRYKHRCRYMICDMSDV